MRVSTGMIFDLGVSSVSRQTASLLHLQQQIASNRRILRPSDDPVSAARALEVTQASDVVAQFKRNQDSAVSDLALEEGYLISAVDVLARARELAILSGNPTLTDNARKGIAIELRARFDQLLGIANSSDGSGNYMFGGYMSSTTPFGGSVDNILAGNEIVYQGDDGQRKLQVSPTRTIEVSDSGVDVFRRVRNGNGYFSASYTAGNSGTGSISSGSVSNPASWSAATTKNVSVRFSVTAGVTSYDLVDTVSGNSLLTGGLAPAPVVNQRSFQPGQPIELQSQGAEPAFDLGSSLIIGGAPANGDSFSIAPSTSQSIFATLSKLIGAVEAPGNTPVERAKLDTEIGFALTNLDQASENISRIRSQIGSRMNEIDAIANLTVDLGLQYQQTLSNLQDLDFAKAISDFTLKQTNLEAAQLSFTKISQLSLFNFLR